MSQHRDSSTEGGTAGLLCIVWRSKLYVLLFACFLFSLVSCLAPASPRGKSRTDLMISSSLTSQCAAWTSAARQQPGLGC